MLEAVNQASSEAPARHHRPHGFPRSVKVGARVYELVYSREAILEEKVDFQDAGVDAVCDHGQLRMTFDPKLADEVTRENVLHETLHAVFNTSGWQRSHNEEATWTIESIIRVVAPGMLQVLMDNPDFGAYMSPHLRAQIEHQQNMLDSFDRRNSQLVEEVAERDQTIESLREEVETTTQVAREELEKLRVELAEVRAQLPKAENPTQPFHGLSRIGTWVYDKRGTSSGEALRAGKLAEYNSETGCYHVVRPDGSHFVAHWSHLPQFEPCFDRFGRVVNAPVAPDPDATVEHPESLRPIVHAEGRDCPTCGWPGEFTGTFPRPGHEKEIPSGGTCPTCGAWRIELTDPPAEKAE